MIKHFKHSAIAILAVATAACSGGEEAPEAETSTETMMDEVDVIDGTISDDMVDVDAQSSGDSMAEGDGETSDAAADENGAGNGSAAEASDEDAETPAE